MRTRHAALRAHIALVTALSLVGAPHAPLAAASATQGPPTGAARPTPTPKAAAAAAPKTTSAAISGERSVDGGWPRTAITSSGADLAVYQPQISSWIEQRRMTAFAAVAYQAKGAQKSELGTITLEADTKVSVGERLVNFSLFRIVEANFPALAKDQVRDITAEIEKAIPEEERVIALDRVMASLDASRILARNAEGVKAEPPAIFFSKTPALLINLDGEPIWSPIKDNDLKYAVNTNWDLFQHGPSNRYFLRSNDVWLKTSDLKGPWQPAGTLPASFSKLPADDNWKDVRAALPGKALAPAQVPKVFVSTTPAEMILLRGEPSYVTAAGSLLWVNNTESDVFRLGRTGTVFFLVAGRWFSAADFTGPWAFSTPSLPPEFQKIPLEHDRSRVLASVPGTQQAAEAVLLAQVPQTARVNKTQLQAPDVAYQGEATFEAIEPTSVQRAVNTDKDIIKVGDLYYMCFQGVWFVGRSASGPWAVASSVPSQIYDIPASSPAHNVTYVTVVEDDNDDDEWVTYAAVAGYTGMMVAWGCAVWGTGYYYPPYFGYGGYYPYYYPHYPTYGYGAWYNPWTGGYGRSAVAYGPYGGAGITARYNPSTGTYARGAAAWGPYGARGVAEAYNPRTGTYAQTRQGSSVYGSWGTTAVQRGDDWATTSRVTSRATGNTTRVTRTDEGAGTITRRGSDGTSRVGRTDSGDIYAGSDGNVYRRQEGGGWEKYDNGGWNNAERPTQNNQAGDRGAASSPDQDAIDRGTRDQIDRDSRARSEGAQRTADYDNYRNGNNSSPRSTGSYRPSGGASRGGGSRGGGRRR